MREMAFPKRKKCRHFYLYPSTSKEISIATLSAESL